MMLFLIFHDPNESGSDSDRPEFLDFSPRKVSEIPPKRGALRSEMSARLFVFVLALYKPTLNDSH